MPKSDNRFNKSRSSGKKPAYKTDRKGSDSKKSYGSKDSSDKPRFDKRERSSGGDRKEGCEDWKAAAAMNSFEAQENIKKFCK